MATSSLKRENTSFSSRDPENKARYDIFLSFRGLDTRKKFTDHLYHALKHEGFQTFRDDDEIQRGEVIKSELLKSIRNSRMSVIVLSEKYAESMACLFELQLILEQYKKWDHFVLPVFYEVDPLEIKEKAKKLDFGEKKATGEEVKAWIAALKEVTSMAGMVFPSQTNGSICTAIRAWLFSSASERVLARLRKNLFSHLIKQEIAFLDVTRTGELLSRLSEDTQIIKNAATTNLSEALRNVTTAIIGVAFMFTSSWKLTFAVRRFGRYLRELSHKTQAAAAVASSIAEESFGAIRTVRSFAREAHAISNYSGKVDETLKLGIQQADHHL